MKLFVNGRDDIFRDTYYTADVWQIICNRVTEDRACLEVHML